MTKKYPIKIVETAYSKCIKSSKFFHDSDHYGVILCAAILDRMKKIHIEYIGDASRWVHQHLDEEEKNG